MVLAIRSDARRGLYYTGCSRFSWEIVYNARERMCGLLYDLRATIADAIIQHTNVLHVERAGYKNRRKR